MCGIVGYCGPLNPKDVIVGGLKKLEYRGYDSAGVAILDNGSLKRVRASGKLIHLEEKLKNETFDGHLGIGHTRWATHGRPSERNAHPHQIHGVSIVHNGIIENYEQIRDELTSEGVHFTSETDSELIAHLIEREVKNEKDLQKAVVKVIPRLKGAYAVLAIWEDEPETLVAFKNGPPLVVGLSEGQSFVASDIQALIEHTKEIIYIEDHEVVAIKNCQVSVFSLDGKPVKKETVQIDWDTEQVEKQGYAHFMLKEIYEQPRAVAAAVRDHINLETMSVELKDLGISTKDLARVERIFIVACGTSYYAGMYGEYLIENMARIPVEVDIASEFRYRNPVIPKNSMVVTISQSGETADTLAALKLVKSQGALCLSICNVKNSTIDREAQGHLYMNAGPEIGVASTKAFLSTLALFNLLSSSLASARDLITKEDEKKYLEALLAVPSQMESVLAYDKFFAVASETLKKRRGFLYLGRGVSYPMALEGALKLKELAYLHAEGYAAGEMKHGPLALIDESMVIVMVAPDDDLYEKSVSNLEEARARGGKVISIGTGENEKLKKLSDHYLSLPDAYWTVNPLLTIVPLQLMAYHLADSLGHDVDQPRNLAKSVTVE